MATSGLPQVIVQGIPKLGTPIANPEKQGIAPGNYSGMTMVGGVPTGTADMIKPGDTVVKDQYGFTTVLGKDGSTWRVGEAPKAEVPSGGGGGASAGIPKSSAAPPKAPTKVNGPQNVKSLLPAFSPPAMNQFPSFYDPNQYLPVAGSSNLPQGYSGQTLPDVGNQAAIAKMLGVPWSASTLNLNQAGGYGMPQVDMSQGGGLKSNYVNPQTYGFISPVLQPSWYQGPRVGKTSK